MVDPPPFPVGVGLATEKTVYHAMYGNFWNKMLVLGVKSCLIESKDIKFLS